MGLISGSVDQTSSPEAKIALFRSLFRGRDDVYPRRFESRKTGRSGYAPACANEWVRGVCEKPRIKCADCPNRRFLPVTDDVIRWHLSGSDAEGQPFVAGVYPLLLDSRGVASQQHGSNLSNSFGEAVNDIAPGYTVNMEFKRITTNPRQMGGVPCLRGLRIPVATVVALVAEGQTTEGILALYPDLEADDVREALLFAAEAVRERALPLAAGE
jgi:uncharacterized protein (DUF433 family)